MHVSGICLLLTVFQNIKGETLTAKTLYESIILVTSLLSNILICFSYLDITNVFYNMLEYCNNCVHWKAYMHTHMPQTDISQPKYWLQNKLTRITSIHH
jgi:hypothetical protein